jgi:hypothetical protein
MIQKRVLAPHRVRHLPKNDWAWVDRRFLRDFAHKLSGDAVFLYYLLAAVSDKHGLSFYGDSSLGRMLRTPLNQLLKARQELIDLDLIVYEAPLVQLLPLPNKSHTQVASSLTEDAKATADSYQQLIALLAAKQSVNNKQEPA